MFILLHTGFIPVDSTYDFLKLVLVFSQSLKNKSLKVNHLLFIYTPNLVLKKTFEIKCVAETYIPRPHMKHTKKKPPKHLDMLGNYVNQCLVNG